MGFSDTTDWIGQLILQAILGEKPHDYLQLPKQSKNGFLRSYSNLKEKLEQGKTNKPPSHPMKAYCGCYDNSIGNFVHEIAVSVSGAGLTMMAQEQDSVIYDLLHYNKNKFYWSCDQEEEMCN
ncbi:hypothetical protein ONS95_005305 [Cadophora gregata]|uniref:uncharacterized protein n=1 Tax=Cadophora gregata TaxID=51156 RepID=UPI0026DB4495|nr:uncharacterized protein ONS95_005305 [Cadophora gregata]KAK0103272.1 hypothetical protein ONS95_005305 [Cadophora gregata]KAK0107465.1 hypothetical protein ONS96_003278 [Cadophora gregata f. sp. sojae]